MTTRPRVHRTDARGSTVRGTSSHRTGAALVAALVAALALATAGCTSSGSPDPGASTVAPAPTSTPVTDVTGSPSGAPSSTNTSSSPTSAATNGRSAAVVHQKLSNVRVASVTFVGNEGWLLGTADCLNGSGAHCTAIEHSTDSGRTWRSMRSPVGVHVYLPTPGSGGACPSSPCVDGIRYATSTIGYLFGNASISPDASQALYMTTDGGQHWSKQSGGADALETADGNVIRVVDQGGCPPGCAYSVQLAPVGSTVWHSVTLPGHGAGSGVGVALARAGKDAYIVSYGHTAGGGETATSVLWSSTNNGASWTNRGEPCAQLGGKEYDGGHLTVTPGGAAVLTCTPRFSQQASPYITVVSSGRAHVQRGSMNALGTANIDALGAASSKVIFVSSDNFYRSSAGGNRFQRLGANGGSSPGTSSWIGFSSASVGHTISMDGRSLWLTTDGGRTWTKSRLG